MLRKIRTRDDVFVDDASFSSALAADVWPAGAQQQTLEPEKE